MLFDDYWQISVSDFGLYFLVFELNTVRMRENTDQKNSEYGYFLHSGYFGMDMGIKKVESLFYFNRRPLISIVKYKFKKYAFRGNLLILDEAGGLAIN